MFDFFVSLFLQMKLLSNDIIKECARLSNSHQNKTGDTRVAVSIYTHFLLNYGFKTNVLCLLFRFRVTIMIDFVYI